MNSEIIRALKTRAKIASYIRRFLDNKNLTEVETPMLRMVSGGGGGGAPPFVTHNVASEFSLKMFITGGIDGVYDIGKRIRTRNEGSYPVPVTNCEFYMAYKDYYDMMKITEDMLSGMVKELTGGYTIKYHANGSDHEPIKIDFTPPFRRIELIEELEKVANLNIPKNLASYEANKYLIDACARFDVNCPPPQTTTRLLAKLVGEFLEVTCVNPTFIIDHPEIMSSFARSHRSKQGLGERAELFINRYEICNITTELNDPLTLRKRFDDLLQKDKESVDDDAKALCEDFCTVLEYGPPSAGCRLDMDTLSMLLSDTMNKDVILFPGMRRQPPDEPADY